MNSSTSCPIKTIIDMLRNGIADSGRVGIRDSISWRVWLTIWMEHTYVGFLEIPCLIITARNWNCGYRWDWNSRFHWMVPLVENSDGMQLCEIPWYFIFDGLEPFIYRGRRKECQFWFIPPSLLKDQNTLVIYWDRGRTFYSAKKELRVHAFLIMVEIWTKSFQ